MPTSNILMDLKSEVRVIYGESRDLFFIGLLVGLVLSVFLMLLKPYFDSNEFIQIIKENPILPLLFKLALSSLLLTIFFNLTSRLSGVPLFSGLILVLPFFPAMIFSIYHGIPLGTKMFFIFGVFPSLVSYACYFLSIISGFNFEEN